MNNIIKNATKTSNKNNINSSDNNNNNDIEIALMVNSERLMKMATGLKSKMQVDYENMQKQ